MAVGYMVSYPPAFIFIKCKFKGNLLTLKPEKTKSPFTIKISLRSMGKKTLSNFDF